MSPTVPEHLLAYLLDRISLGVFVVNRDMEITYWNRFMVIHSRRTADEVIGRNLFECFPQLPQRWFERKIRSVFILKNFAFTSWQQRPYLFEFPHNRPITGGVAHMYQDCTLLPICDAAGEVTSVCISLQDVTDAGIYQTMLKDARDKLERISKTDALTQLYNRGYWETRFKEECSRVERYGGALTLILFDLDHFKRINDGYGHLAGDEVLRRVAAAARQALREIDIAGRYGGEEFAVALPATDLAGATNVAERLRLAVEALDVRSDGKRIPVSISLGVAAYDPAQRNDEELIKRADGALYHAKEHGRNRWHAFPAVPDAVPEGASRKSIQPR